LGRSPGGRIYGFVTTADGRDLGERLVTAGLGRAHGAKRTGPTGESSAKTQQRLVDLESEAMLARRGIWAATDPQAIARLREEQRAEDREIKELLRESSGKGAAPGSIDLNRADARALQSISGVGPVLAAKIIAGRPYKSVDDLLRVSGIGPKLFAKIQPYVVVNPPALSE
jgi:DNA uptake protein ComE-like DNA-binding protein